MPSNLNPVEQEELQKQIDQQAYQWLVQQHQPRTTWLRNTILAFLVGGIICTLGQIIQNYFRGFGLTLREAGTVTVFIMVFLGAFLTGLGIYDKIGKYGGAGSIIPITGFANSIVASAMEFKREGYVYGVGARLFNVAGPVLTFGFIISVLIGLLYYFFT
ncbi:MAG: stage V sporulation protein AC [Syntrophomonadaceae bacterium]|nr:stage V sporulation protein AC [Syntrophomonadaceae bacterium]